MAKDTAPKTDATPTENAPQTPATNGAPAQAQESTGARRIFHFPEHENVYTAAMDLAKAYYRRDVTAIKAAKENLAKVEAEFKAAMHKHLEF